MQMKINENKLQTSNRMRNMKNHLTASELSLGVKELKKSGQLDSNSLALLGSTFVTSSK